MEIHQVVVSASPGDAVTNSALEYRTLLRNACRSEVFAQNIHPALDDDVLPLAAYGSHSDDINEDVILFHASIGSPEVLTFIRRRPERVGVIYHNISPAQYFYPYDPAFAGLLDGGRRELRVLRSRSVLTLADSNFNAAELRGMEYADVRVSPLVVDAKRLVDITPDADVAGSLAGIDGPKYLFVGQQLPHKRPDFLIMAFHVLSTYLVPEAHLFIVGAARLPPYAEAIKQLVVELNLGNVHFAHDVSDAELAAYYRGCDVFVTPSEHEGFCIPLLEAMAFDLPIIARDHAAIPETLGHAGVLLESSSGAIVLAEAMLEMVSNSDLVAELTRRGQARLEDFDPDRSRAQFLEHVLELVR